MIPFKMDQNFLITKNFSKEMKRMVIMLLYRGVKHYLDRTFADPVFVENKIQTYYRLIQQLIHQEERI
ncbi:hypothetical protein CS562_29390 [Paenibacillus sp. LK1]|nr:hypothetical protein CS562_29390 [Paenibacillus sp. LK1]